MTENGTHVPVLLKEVISLLLTDPQGTYVDCTVGGGGHIEALMEITQGKADIIGIDKDALVLNETRKKFAGTPVKFYHADFSALQQVLTDNHIAKIDGLIADLGISSFQLDQEARGFSYHKDGPLDMRMNQGEKVSAEYVVNEYTEAELKKIIYLYGEERFAPRISRAIVKARKDRTISTTGQLAEIVKLAVPGRYRYDKHPARKTFQAVRIEVNNELGALENMLPQALEVLKTGGRMVFITFHSLEDRLVKNFMKYEAQDCVCTDKAPICTCNHRARLKLLNKKPVTPSREEVETNKRARSAKLRAAVKL
jgi:16S rRNA (cytosine1402-N4)-methyltransferase